MLSKMWPGQTRGTKSLHQRIESCASTLPTTHIMERDVHELLRDFAGVGLGDGFVLLGDADDFLDGGLAF